MQETDVAGGFYGAEKRDFRRKGRGTFLRLFWTAIIFFLSKVSKIGSRQDMQQLAQIARIRAYNLVSFLENRIYGLKVWKSRINRVYDNLEFNKGFYI